MDSQSKVVVVAKEGVALLGNAFHVLNDFSATQFTTESIKNFLEYITKAGPDNDGGPFELYYTVKGVEAYITPLTRYSVLAALCTLKQSPYLNRLMEIANKDISIDQFEKLLRSMRKFLDASGLDLLSHVRDLSVSKITSVRRKKDNAGNFSYEVKRESGAGDFTPPDRIVFTIPLFATIDQAQVNQGFCFDVVFSIKEPSSADKPEPVLMFKLESLNMEDEVSALKIREIQIALASVDNKFFGSAKVLPADDGWKYKQNKVG